MYISWKLKIKMKNHMVRFFDYFKNGRDNEEHYCTFISIYKIAPCLKYCVHVLIYLSIHG